MKLWMHIVLAAALAVVAVPLVVQADEMLKEHECVGADTQLDIDGSDGIPSAGCTPEGAELYPPDGAGVYTSDDIDTNFGSEFPGPTTQRESFTVRGALEVLPRPSGVFQTIPTEKEQNQIGFPATANWVIGLKSSSIRSNLEVICSVCAERPETDYPAETFVDDYEWVGYDHEIEGEAAIVPKLNMAERPWKLSAHHICGNGNPICSRGDRNELYAITIPGLQRRYSDPMDYEGRGALVEFLGCKPKTIIIENPGGLFFRGDFIDVRLDVPETARADAKLDVSSCEISYLRGCRPNENFNGDKPICSGS